MIKGAKISLGGQEWILPPLNLEDLEKYWGFISGKEQPTEPMEIFLITAEVIHAALKRNYPDITLIELKKHFDIPTLKQLLADLQKASGLVDISGETPGET